MTILFICTGNVARSQLAEGYLKQLRPDLSVESAGVDVTVGKPLDPLVLRVAREDGLDLALAYRKELTIAMLTSANYVVSFVEAAKLPGGIAADETWLVPDPRGAEIEVHRATRDEIKRRVVKLANASID